MKKRCLAGLVFALSMAMFTGCGQAEETTDTEAQETVEAEVTEDAETEETADAEEAADTEVQEETVSEVTLETYEGDGWTLQYDPEQIVVNAGDDGTVIFAYYSEEYTQAGSDYMMISKVADTDYETVLADKQEEYDAADEEIIEAYYGADGVMSYGFTKLTEPSEESGLQIYASCNAIPVGEDVILLESYITVEPEDEDMMRIDAAFETVAGTFALTDETSASDTSEYQTYEFDTYDGTTVTIDDSNIVSQEANDDPLSWEDLPEDAEQLAPGRDYILFGSGDKYYVEDAANGLVTVANK